MHKFGGFLGVLIAAIFCLAHYAAAEQYCDVFKTDNVHSYIANEKISFYKKSDNEKVQPEDAAAYIIPGDYFIAGREQGGARCAAYMPDGVIKAAGYIMKSDIIKDDEDDETDTADKTKAVKVKQGEYSALLGRWQPSQLQNPWKEEIVRFYPDGDAIAADYKAAGKDAASPLLKIGKNSFIYGAKGEYKVRPEDGKLTVTFDEASRQYLLQPDCFDMSDIFAYVPQRDSDADLITTLAADEQAHSYKAGGKLPFYKLCPEGLCPTGAYMIKGDYFLARKQKDGTYCAAYLPKGIDKVKAFGIIKPGDFAETPDSDYEELTAYWQRTVGAYPAAWSVWVSLVFGSDDNGITGEGIAKWVVNDDDEGPTLNDDQDKPYYPKSSHLSAIGWFLGATVLKVAPHGYFIWVAASEERGAHYAEVTGKKLKMSIAGKGDGFSGFSGIFSADEKH